MDGETRAWMIFGSIFLIGLFAVVIVGITCNAHIQESRSRAYQHCVNAHSPAECKLGRP